MTTARTHTRKNRLKNKFSITTTVTVRIERLTRFHADVQLTGILNRNFYGKHNRFPFSEMKWLGAHEMRLNLSNCVSISFFFLNRTLRIVSRIEYVFYYFPLTYIFTLPCYIHQLVLLYTQNCVKIFSFSLLSFITLKIHESNFN